MFELQIRPYDSSLCKWNNDLIDEAAPLEKKQTSQINYHRKSLSVNRRPSIQTYHAKTEASSQEQNSSLLSKKDKLESVRKRFTHKIYEPSTPSAISANQKLIDKFKACR